MRPLPVLLHSPSTAHPPAGVWWSDGSSQLRKFYVNKNLQVVGEHAVGPAAGRADTFDTNKFFQSMADSQPTPDDWDVATVSEMSPVEYLRFVRKHYSQSAKTK